MIFGFLLAVCFNPYIYTAATNPRWAFLAISLPVMIWVSSPNHFTLNHLLGLIFLAWSALSLLWTANLPDGASSLIQLSIAAMAFVLGARSASLKPILGGLALGLTVSSLIVLFQINASQIISTKIEGLFGNRDMLAETAAMVLVGCIGYRLWWFIPGLIPAIVIYPYPRAAWLSLTMALIIYVWSRSRKLAALLVLSSVFALVILINLKGYSTLERWTIWTETYNGLNYLGHGIGSFYFLYPYLTNTFDTTLMRPEHAHNELLEIWFELGFVGTFIYVCLVASAYRSAGIVLRCILGAFVTIAMFAFPSHAPFTALVGAMVLGHAVRSGSSIWEHDSLRGLELRARNGGKHTPATANRVFEASC